MRKLLLLCGSFLLVSVCGCSGLRSGLDKLPKQPEAEVSHNQTSGMEIEGNSNVDPELNENFANKYINMDEFERMRNETVSGISKTQGNFSKADAGVSEIQKNINEEYEEISKSAENSLSDKEEQVEKELNETINEKKSTIEETKNKYLPDERSKEE